MGLFGGKDDTKAKIDELKAKMQGGAQAPPQQQQGWQPPQQQAWQPPQQSYQPPQQSWQPPAQEQPKVEPQPSQSTPSSSYTTSSSSSQSYSSDDYDTGIILDLGDGMSLNLPVKSRMRLDEFLRIADRVRELKKIEHQQHY